jgi:hypothetical protein
LFRQQACGHITACAASPITGHGHLEHATIVHSPRTYYGASQRSHAVDLAAVDIVLLLEPATVDAGLVGLVLVAVDGGRTSTLTSRYPGKQASN